MLQAKEVIKYDQTGSKGRRVGLNTSILYISLIVITSSDITKPIGSRMKYVSCLIPFSGQYLELVTKHTLGRCRRLQDPWFFRQHSHNNGFSKWTWVHFRSSNGEKRIISWNIDYGDAQWRLMLESDICLFDTGRRMHVTCIHKKIRNCPIRQTPSHWVEPFSSIYTNMGTQMYLWRYTASKNKHWCFQVRAVQFTCGVYSTGQAIRWLSPSCPALISCPELVFNSQMFIK